MQSLVNPDIISINVVTGDSSLVDSLADTNIPAITSELAKGLGISYDNISHLLPDVFNGWYLYFFIAIFAGYAIARTYLGSLSRSTFMAAIRYNTAVSMFNDNSQLQRQRDNVLYTFYFLTAGPE